MFSSIGKIVDTITGHNHQSGKRIKGTVILVKSNVLDFNDFTGSIVDRIGEFLGKGVCLQLVSAEHAESANALKGKVGKKAYLENWLTSMPSLTPGDSAFQVTFDYEEAVGTPGAIIINNNHASEFFLKNITLENVPGEGDVHFDCNSWVYPGAKYGYERVFFRNKTYIKSEMPAPLLYYRDLELKRLRGDGKGERKEWDRIYDYDVYNDVGDPDKGPEYARQILGGCSDFPYPRRVRTGRTPSASDPKSESRMFILNGLNVYVPRDEQFGHLKMSDFLAYGLKSLGQGIKPALEGYLDSTEEWDSFREIYELYDEGFKLPDSVLKLVQENVPFAMFKEIFRTDGEDTLKFPKPAVIKKEKWAWRTDAEFAREMLAGVNPVVIKRLEEFPPRSKLDSSLYGNHTSEITEQHIEKSLEGKRVFEALDAKRLYILDHHDTLMPYLNKVNSLKSTRIYATRTILYLKDDGTLKPVAIELSLPHPDGYQHGAVNDIYTPAEEGTVQGTIWQLAKAYVAVNDSGVHQLVSHWLNTHAVMEPFVIATNRQLSVAHPIYKLLHPHFRDTVFINGLARQTLINAGGVMESTVFPGKYAMEMSAVIYKSWALTDHAFPADLLKRGVAVADATAPNGVRLLIEDYPYAVDGLEIWSAVKHWVEDYTSLFYKSDEVVQKDTELQAWWKEVREVGHGDKKDEPWWPEMQTCKELVDTLTTLIWIASALHAAVNFGQYSYAGFIPCRPTLSRRFMPKEGTEEFKELKSNPEAAFLKTITAELQTLLGISLIEILSRHASDEVYLGKRFSEQWAAESGPIQAFEKFGKKLKVIEDNILRRNKDPALKNRAGPANFPYTLLFPTSEPGLTAKGIPNSISI